MATFLARRSLLRPVLRQTLCKGRITHTNSSLSNVCYHNHLPNSSSFGRRNAHTVIIPVTPMPGENLEAETTEPVKELYTNKFEEIQAVRENWEDLLEVYSTEGEEFDIGDFVMTFNLIGVCVKEHPSDTILLHINQDFVNLIEQVIEQVPYAGADYLAGLASGLGKFNKEFVERFPRLQEVRNEVAKAAVGKLQFQAKLDSLKLILKHENETPGCTERAILEGMAAEHGIDHASLDHVTLVELLQVAASEMQERATYFGEFEARQLSELMWGMAKLNHSDRKLMKECCKRAKQIIDDFTPIGLACLAYSLNALKVSRDKQLWNGILEQAEKKLEWSNQQEVENIVSFFSADPLADSVLAERLATLALHQMSNFSPFSLGSIALSFGKLGYNDPKFLLALTTATQTKMSQLKPIDLQRLTYGLSLIYHRNTSFLAKLLAHAETVLPRFTESEMGHFLTNLSNLDFATSSFLDQICHELTFRHERLGTIQLYQITLALDHFHSRGFSAALVHTPLSQAIRRQVMTEPVDPQAITNLPVLLSFLSKTSGAVDVTSLLTTCVTPLLGVLPELNQKRLNLIAAAYIEQRYIPDELFRPLVTQIAAKSAQANDAKDDVLLVETTTVLSSLEAGDLRSYVFDALATVIRVRASQMSAAQAVQLLCCFGQDAEKHGLTIMTVLRQLLQHTQQSGTSSLTSQARAELKAVCEIAQIDSSLVEQL